MAATAVSIDDMKPLLSGFMLRDANVVANNALDGGDYFATSFRAIPQFFFAYMLPLPIVQLIAIVAVAYKFQDNAKKRREEDLLTDQFILSFLVIKNSVDNNYASLSQQEKEEYERIEAAIERLRVSDKKNIESLKKFARDHAAKIQEIMKEDITPKQDDANSPWSAWHIFFFATLQYAVAHWVFWMCASLYYSADPFNGNAGRNSDYATDPSKLPPILDDQTAFVLEFTLPALFVIAALAYNHYYRLKEEEKKAKARLDHRLEQVGAYYRVTIKETSPSPARTPDLESFTENRILWYTRGSEFLTAFLVFNLFAWPLTMFLQAELGNCNVDPTDRAHLDTDIKIPVVFGASLLLAVLHVYIKDQEMKDELKKVYPSEDFSKTEKTYKPTLSFMDYYFNNPATRYQGTFFGMEYKLPITFIYWVGSRLTGSGGILLARTLFDGGIGGYLCAKADPNGYNNPGSMDHVEEMFGIALALAAIACFLNLKQVYYASQRQQSLTDQQHENIDNAFIEKRSSRSVASQP